jgi:hypothetical protein
MLFAHQELRGGSAEGTLFRQHGSMIGSQFETGLANMKAVAETP